MPTRRLLLGHRGARATGSVPENSLASFDLALQHGCDGFEFDVRLTSDGRTVICHDARVGGVEVARAMRSELSQLAVLPDVLARYGQRAFLDIELKVPGLDEIVLAALKENPPSDYVISSFLPQVLTSLHAHDASLSLGFICDREAYFSSWHTLPVEYVIPHFKLVSKNSIEDVQAAGKKVFVWTVNDKERMLRLAEWGADGVISDDTELLVKTLSATEKD
jgi:glycerophosphoryl diester phosphodiesterase